MTPINNIQINILIKINSKNFQVGFFFKDFPEKIHERYRITKNHL